MLSVIVDGMYPGMTPIFVRIAVGFCWTVYIVTKQFGIEKRNKMKHEHEKILYILKNNKLYGNKEHRSAS